MKAALYRPSRSLAAAPALAPADVARLFTRRTLVCGMPGLVVLGCRSASAPSYLRISGSAPPIPGAPPSTATLVFFWASWCAPCREETPSLQRLAEKRPEGLGLVVVSHDASMEAVRAFLKGAPPVEWHLRLDPERVLSDAFRVGSLPVTILVVRGQMVARFTGPQDWTSRGMKELLQRLIVDAPVPA